MELEKTRYADPIASRELILKHLREAPEPLSAARLAKRLGLQTDMQRQALAKRLAAMVRDGQAIEGPNGFATAGEGERVVGRVRGRCLRCWRPAPPGAAGSPRPTGARAGRRRRACACRRSS